MALDRHGRRIHYLRISLTDHCNLRCVYCMPEDMTFRPNAELMQDDEILQLVRLFTRLGFDKIRLTGGEPTVRAGVVELVRGIASTPGVRSLTMTTNGVLLGRLAQPLAEAGLQRVNVSLDTLDPDKFHTPDPLGLAGGGLGGHPGRRGSRAAAGQDQLRSSCAAITRADVARPGPPDPGPSLAGALHRDDALRRGHRPADSQVVTAPEMQALIEAALGPLEPLNGGALDGEARLYRLPGAQGDVGFISSVIAAVLRRLHARPPDRGRPAAPVPAARGRGRPAHPAARRRHAGRAAPS